jgi:hypothetical protein
MQTMRCRLHEKLSKNRICYSGRILPAIATPIRAGLLFGEDRDKLVQLVITLIVELDETKISSPNVHSLAVEYIDEVSHYTRVQQLDNTFWGRTSSFRIKGHPYVRKNKRPIVLESLISPCSWCFSQKKWASQAI